MMKNFTFFLGLMLALGSLMAQAPDTVSIKDIQFVPQATLANCVDTSAYENDTVVTYATVVMDGGLAQANDGRNLWLQDTVGPWSGIDLYAIGAVPDPTPGTDVLDLVAGDSIEIRGLITSFGNESEIAPLEITLLAQGRPVTPTVVSIADLNDDQRINQLPTGEQWEGVYAEIQDVTVTSVDFFSGGSRVSFNVQDNAGNVMNISDRFLVQRLPANGGTFVPPNVGTKYEFIRGVIAHSGNGCTGANGRGYELYPFQASDYKLEAGFSAPQISNINRSPLTPTSSQDVSITADIQDLDGVVTTATLNYAVGISNNTYTQIPMTLSTGITYTATIPSAVYADGDFVKFYISAEDDSLLVANQPDVPNNLNPISFRVRDNGLTIQDLQFTPFSDGNSIYVGQDVTVEGVVISSAEADNLGFVYIQQEGNLNEWAGIGVTGNAALANLLVGDKVEVTGQVQESFGLTIIGNISNVTNTGTGTITPLVLDPSLFSTYDVQVNEKYESMLIQLEDPSGGPVYVVNPNADDPSNFAEWRVGTDLFDPANGCRLLTGRVTGSAQGSLNVSYINDSTWINNNGVLRVPACVIAYGDSMTSVAGVMHYSFGNMKLLPRNNVDFVDYSGENCPNGVQSIADQLAGSVIKAFPNPASQNLQVEYSFPVMAEANVRLLDLMGRQLAVQPTRGMEGKINLSVSSFSAGTYLLVVESEGFVISRQKIMVTR